MSIISRIVDWIATPYTVYLILKDRTISRSIKLRAAIGLALIFIYVVSPIDIIPDFIPLSGWIDDLIVLPLGLVLVRKFTPGINIVEKRARAQRSIRQILLWTMLSILVFIFLSLLWLGLLIYAIVRLITH
jgi:uncharacterized membrane protein YkvA (DUF1232 family)